MTYQFAYSIHNCHNHEQSKDAWLSASDMEDAIEKILSLCPAGWHYYFIEKEPTS